MDSDNKIYGKWGEDRAVKYLKEAGYQILERNWVYRKTELDIIASIEDILVFVEVKTRKNDDYGYPEDAVGLVKENNIMNAAEAYVELNDIDSEIRFDIISIIGTPGNEKIFHFEDAISPYDI